ncbi:kelch-like ECH-associated protein 1 [Oppia nitens]|uniref:kelch-like ECH-associated protein 1 n=1 Tax=Oppia nitens TaxID=1686743 RepID=UPI0023D9CD53|nr:kelch-like ECH-associated protein 1 [Oppia nitens]
MSCINLFSIKVVAICLNLATIYAFHLTSNQDLLNNPDEIYACGGYRHLDRDYANCNKYNIQTNEWESIESLSIARNLFNLVAFNNKLYAIGGNHDSDNLDINEVYDPNTGNWTYTASLITKRFGAGADVLNNKIYVCGGRSDKNGDGQEISSCESYSTETGKWQSLAPMSVARSFHALVAHEGYLYAIGGESKETVERYDPKTNLWTPVASLTQKRSLPGAVVYNNKIYVCGGVTFHDKDPSNTCEAYDTKTNKWTQIVELDSNKWDLHLLVNDGRLYLAGGKDENIIELFNDKSKLWKRQTIMPLDYYGQGVAILTSK